MSLNIKVLHLRSNQVFHPGDQISGHVIATGPIKDKNTSIMINFTGSAKVKLKVDGTKVPYFDEHAYFSFHKALFRGPCNVDEGSSASWPFKFELPSDPRKIEKSLEPIMMRNGDRSCDAERNPYKLAVQKAAPLPPSFSISGSQGGMVTNTVNYKGSVSYEVCAELQRGKTFTRTWRAKGGLPVTLCRPLARTEEADIRNSKEVTRLESFLHSSSRLQAGREDQSRSLRQWTSDALSRGKTPRVYFRLSARMPTVLIRGNEIPLHLSLKIEQGGAKARGGTEQLTTATPPLQFEFLTARYEFKALTKLDASYLWSSHETEVSDVIFSCELKIDPEQTIWTGEEEPIEIERQMAIPPKAKKIVPSFKAKHIERYYFAKLIMEVKVGGKKFEAKFRWAPVTVLTEELERPDEGEEIMAGIEQDPGMTIIGTSEVEKWGLEALNGIVEIVGDILS